MIKCFIRLTTDSILIIYQIYLQPDEPASGNGNGLPTNDDEEYDQAAVDSKPGWVRNHLQSMFQPTDNKLAMKLFGSKKALIQERVRQKAAGHWIIHPCSSFR